MFAPVGLLVLISVARTRGFLDKATEFPCSLGDGCAVEFKLHNHVYHFAIDTGEKDSYASTEFLKDVQSSKDAKSFNLGPQSIALSDLQNLSSLHDLTEPTSVDGLLGMNVLTKIAFGIDYERQVFAVWPQGVSAKAVDQWAWGESTGLSATLTVMTNTKCVYLESDFGWLLLSSLPSATILPKIADKQQSFLTTGVTTSVASDGWGELEVEIAPTFKATLVSVDNFPVLVSSKIGPDEGMVWMGALCKRFSLNGPEHTCSLCDLKTGFDHFKAVFSFLLAGQSTFEDGKLFMHGNAADPSDGKAKDIKCQILSINSIKMDDLIAAYGKNDNSAAAMMNSILKGGLEGCKMDILVDGKPATVDFNIGQHLLDDGIAL